MKKSFLLLILSIGFVVLAINLIMSDHWYGWAFFLLAGVAHAWRDEWFLDEETEEIEESDGPCLCDRCLEVYRKNETAV